MVTIAYPPGRWDSEESQRVCSVKTAAGKTAQVHNRVLIWLKKKAERKQGRPLGEGKTDLPVGSLLTINLDSREGQSPTWMGLSSRREPSRWWPLSTLSTACPQPGPDFSMGPTLKFSLVSPAYSLKRDSMYLLVSRRMN